MTEKKQPARTIRGSWSHRLGMPTTRGNTTQDQINYRSEQARRNKMLKPTLPKMPWDKKEEKD